MANKQITFETFMLSTDRQLSFQREVAYTNDVNSVRLSFNIKDLDDLASYTPNVLLYMRDGSFYQITDGIAKTGTTVSYTLKGNEGKHNGVVRVQLVLIDGDKDLASAKHEFRIETGLDNVVATEVMIQDWTTLVKEAREYIDEFYANETQRQADFDNAQTSNQSMFNDNESNRQSTFELNEQTRQTDFDNTQANRQSTFNASESNRKSAFNTNEQTRQTNEDARIDSEETRNSSESERISNEEERELNEQARASAESVRVANEEERVSKDSERDSKIEAVEEDVVENKNRQNEVETQFQQLIEEIDDTIGNLIISNLIPSGDVSDGLPVSRNFGYDVSESTDESAFGDRSVKAKVEALNTSARIVRSVSILPHKYYLSFQIYPLYATATNVAITLTGSNSQPTPLVYPTPNKWNRVSGVIDETLATNSQGQIRFTHSTNTQYTLGNNVYYDGFLMIDLTDIFGEGNEPTKAEMDILVDMLGGWFDGNLTVNQTQITVWTLNMIRQNRYAITALGGTIL